MSTHAEITALVESSYNEIAPRYLSWAASRPSTRDRYTGILLERLPPGSRVLELGCGPGIPITRRLAEHGSVLSVVANDISRAQLDLARANCQSPKTMFVQGDMMSLDFPVGTLTAVISFFALFHLPRTEHANMLQRMFNWLAPGGYVVANFGAADKDAIWNDDFLGAKMFWSTFGVEGTKELLRTAGFEVLDEEVCPAADGLIETDPDYGINFLWIVARRPSRGAVS